VAASFVPPDVEQNSGDGSNQSIVIDNGRYVAAVVICAVLCGASWVYAWHADQRSTEAITEYRVMLNHQMYLENQVENLKEKHDALRR
jgi:hypothetical protein